MNAYDFEYDGLRLSDFGCIICKFDGGGTETVTNGSQISLNTVSTLMGAKQELVSSKYEECLEAVFQICKNTCSEDDAEFSLRELRDLMRWLNRREFHKCKFIAEDYVDFYFEATFNISRIEIGGKIVGLELTMKTNSPFAFGEPQTMVIHNTAKSGRKSIANQSDAEGYVYPSMEIFIRESGDLYLYNDFEKRTTLVKNCTAGETITMNYPIIQSSLPAHKIQDDFNWNFFRLANTVRHKKNDLTISLPCTITLRYSPVIQAGI